MARILGIILPDDKRVEYALTLFYGVGWHTAGKVLAQSKIDKNKKVKDITEEEWKKITAILDKEYKIEGDLREEISESVKRLKDIGCYRGVRHIKSLPVRGQRTRSNARTKRGKRKTVGALKKEAWAKLEQNKVGQEVTAAKATTPVAKK